MYRSHRKTALLLPLLAMLALSFGTSAQEPAAPGEAMVSIYRVAAGKHLDFIKWMAEREAVDKEAGVAATQWYAHMDGDGWDYMSIGPQPTEAQDDKIDEILKRRGMKTGFKAGLELRQTLGSHTDTLAAGPLTAAAMLEAAR